MEFTTRINNERVIVSSELVAKYDRPGPRYTSYPTAPVWTDKFGPNDYISVLKNLRTQELKNLSLYFHIPFCEQRCYYCGCSTIATTNHETAARYVDTLIKEVEIVARHIGQKNNVVQLQFGGGTPTYLSSPQIEKLMRAIINNFKLDANAEVGMEIDPRVTLSEQLETIESLGINRVSLGIQDFSPTVQSAIGRIEPYKEVEKMFEKCRSLGFQSVNVDLIYGLPHQTPDSFKSTVEKIIKLSPDRIACFNFAYLPKLLPHQKKLPKEAIPDGMAKFAIFCQTIEQLGSAGYDFIGMDHFAKSTDELSIAAKNGSLWRNFQGYTTKAGTDLIGFGLTSISDVNGCYAQNEKRLIDYYRAIETGNLATIRGWKLSEDDLIRRELIRDLFCKGMTVVGSQSLVVSDQRPMTNDLVNDGLININNDSIQVTPLGRLFVRNIAMLFDRYLSEGKTNFSRTV